MGILEDLFKNSTGLISGGAGDMSGSAGDMAGETSMDVSYDPQQVFKSPSGGFKIDPSSGKQIIQRQPGQGMTPMAPPKKPNDLSSIANKDPGMFKRIFGIDTKTFAENWKNKGGYEGLMANPAFLLGLGIIQSSAQGKPIGSDIFDVAVKSGAISAQYADRMKERQKVLAPVSDAQRDEVRAVLAESDIYESSIGQKFKAFFKGKNTEAMNRRALDEIYQRAEQLIKADTKKYGGRTIRTRREYIEEATKQLQNEQKIETSEKGILNWLFGRGVQSKAKGLAEGGPAKEGKEYIVGEEGPEMFVPEVDGNVINNDDSKVINMLLESNPQLKNVSRARAVKILKARFPDYF